MYGRLATPETARQFDPHVIEWTPEKIERFWNHNLPFMADSYFARSVGRSVIDHVSRGGPIGSAADIGCGQGDLIGYLLERGHRVCGIDQSPDSVETVERRFAEMPGFIGASDGMTALEQVDTVFMLEVVEHMDDSALAKALELAGQLLRPGGRLVLTTPNEEKLDQCWRVCPDCGCTFHHVQHVRSWSAPALASHVSSFGFRTISCAATLFNPETRIPNWVARLGWKLLKGKLPHLIYIGERQGARA